MSSPTIQTQGALWCILLFLLCLIVVHAAKLAYLGWRALGKKLPPEPPKAPEKKAEPVYFLVERKKKRPKTQYSEPKQINFQ